MVYSKACSYAVLAMSYLVLRQTEDQQEYVLLDDVCKQAKLPRHFLAKIFQTLVRQGLLVSAKGRGGGFALARPAERIRLYDIVAAIDGTVIMDRCAVGMAACDDSQPCPQHEQWKSLKIHISQFLNNTTLATMADSLGRKLNRQPTVRRRRTRASAGSGRQ